MTRTPDIETLCRDLSLRMTRRPSVTGTPDEISFGPWLADLLRGMDCFGAAPEVWTFPVAPGDGRLCVGLLVRGSGAATVLLTGHYDTVTTADYGDLQGVAIDPGPLTQGLLARVSGAVPGSAGARVRDDLASGRFLPGRGLLDMKAGLAAGLAAMAAFAAEPGRVGNLMFLAVPDEENASVGARAAARALPGLVRDRGLDLRAVVNLDAIATDGDGAAGRVIAMGTVGKVLPTALVVGTPVHSGYPLRGVNAAVLAGAIAARLEWAPDLTDHGAATPGTPVSLLSLKDGKTGYDVTTPATAWATWSVLNHTRDPAAVLLAVAVLVQQAVAGCLAGLTARAAQSALEEGKVPLAVPVLTHADLAAEVRTAHPDTDAWQAAEARRLLATGASLPDIAQALTLRLWQRSGRAGPAVVLGLGSIPYPATMVDDARLSAAVQALVADAPARHGTDLSTVAYFPGISDMSFFGQADVGGFGALAAQTPGWDVLVGLDAGGVAGVPTVNLGPWGRDYHRPEERIAADYGFRILPGLIGDLAARVLAD